MRLMGRLVQLALLVGTALCSTEVGASTCERWQNDIDACDFPSIPDCNNPGSWTPAQWMTISNWRYSDTKELACGKYWSKMEDFNGLTQVSATVNPLKWDCHMDGNDDGVIDDSDAAFYTQVGLETVPRDTCCDAHVSGPYASLGAFPPTPDGSFDLAQISAVKKANQARNGRLRSDAGVASKPPAKAVKVDYFDVLMTHINKAGRQAQVDHLIPRRDSKGCACGTNSYANALLISAKLNKEMSNSCLDPKRLEIISKYAK